MSFILYWVCLFISSLVVHASEIPIKSVRHRVVVQGQTLSVTTFWELSTPNATRPKALMFGSIYKSKRLSSVRMDGRAAKFSIDAEGLVHAEISAWPRVVELKYDLLEAKTDRLLEIEAREFFTLLPFVSFNGEFTFDTRPMQGLNYSEVIRTSAEVKNSGDLIVYGSAPTIRGTASVLIAPRPVGRFVLGFANPNKYEVTMFDSLGTSFLILSPKGADGFNAKKFRAVIEESWPMYRALFPSPSNWIVLHDDPALPVGAGPTGSNVFGFGYSESVTPEVQRFLFDQAGWPQAKSSADYINRLYQSSPEPLHDYWTMIINHELGHLFFGMGLTAERHERSHAYWMSLGLGLAVDEVLTTKMTGGRPIEFYNDLISYWRKNLAELPVDQRLEGPDISADSKQGVSDFNRLQHFAHGKSLHFWRSVRERMGEARFLELMKDFVKRGGFPGGYLEFRPTLLKELPELPELEREHKII